jgi:hypothetical protein
MKMPAAPSLAQRFVADFTAHNRSVCASGLRPSASATARSFRYAPFPRRCAGTVCRPCKTYGFAYPGRQTVAYSRIIRHFLAQIYRRRRHPWRLK